MLFPKTSTTHRTVKWAWAHPRNNISIYIYIESNRIDETT